jgi:hypothetical protein
MSYRVRKTLVIGLGGTGLRSVQRMKEKYHEVYGTDNIPTTEFLVFDTADKKPLPTANGQDIELQPNEFQKLETTDPKKSFASIPKCKTGFPAKAYRYTPPTDRAPTKCAPSGA